jgi:hypothetical protein
MANPQIIPKRSTVSGRVPETTDLALGEICVNHADRRLYSRNPSTGEVYKLAGTKDAPDRVWAFDLSADGTTTFLGFLLYSDFPNTGSVYDSANWEISRTIFNSAGTTSTESSATGQWSNKENLTYS